jgi:hypothetical protein
MLGVLSSPDIQCAPGLKEACATQEKLSKFECQDKEILPLSLNTFKSAAQVAVENGGWKSLDQLRREIYANYLPVLQARNKIKRSLGTRNSVLRAENHELRERNQALLRGRAVLLSAYFDIFKILRDSQQFHPEIKEKLREHEVRFDIRKQIGEAEMKHD